VLEGRNSLRPSTCIAWVALTFRVGISNQNLESHLCGCDAFKHHHL
jgi:hypothetical protein